MIVHSDTSIEDLTHCLIKDLLAKENFESTSVSKGSFLAGDGVIVCESKGLKEYIQKTCVDNYGIWAALPFKSLSGLLMQCAYNLSDLAKNDEKGNVFDQRNLIWAIYRLLEGDKKTFFFSSELASLFSLYQIYRPELIETWNNGKQYTITNADSNFLNNEKFQRELWIKLKNEYENELDTTQLYQLFSMNDKIVHPKHIFVFCPLSIAPIQLKALGYLSKAGCIVHLYMNQVSNGYFDTEGNYLLSGLGKSAKVLYDLIGRENIKHNVNSCSAFNDETFSTKTKPKPLLGLIQESIINNINLEKNIVKENIKDKSIVANSCFYVLREVEVLCDFLLGLLENNEELTCQDIAVVSPNIEKYADAIELVFERYNIPYIISDRDVKKHDRTAQLLNMLFSFSGSRYEAPDVAALFESSMYLQNKNFDQNDIGYLKKCIKENAIRYGFDNPANPPNYSFNTGFDQIAAGFFMINENGFYENGHFTGKDYCYPDIEGNRIEILGEFADFVKSLQNFEDGCKNKKTIEEWDDFFRENLKPFFGIDETDYNEEDENPYQTVIGAWDSLKKDILIGFGSKTNLKIDFSVLKTSLQNNLESQKKYSYSLSGKISFTNIDTIRAVPHKVICCIGMNGFEFPRQNSFKEINLIQDKQLGDKDKINEDRMIFLQLLLSAKENFYISWIGQNDTTMNKIEPSSVILMLLNDMNEIITKHPLQPFSNKYYNKELTTYDNRWNTNTINKTFNIWDWRIDNNKNQKEKKGNVDNLYRILNDAPKYFIKDVCNISLPEDIDLLDYLEPFAIDSNLDKWILKDTIIQNEELNYLNAIEIKKRRGELPNGLFAENGIKKMIDEAQELKDLAKAEKEGTYWIYPSYEKGKYRLKHWLYHLDLNINNENQSSKMFLKGKEPVILELKGMPREIAKKNLDKLWQLAEELDNRLLPVFPNNAWNYINDGEIDDVDSFVDYSVYAKMIFRNINIIKGKVEKDFIYCSEILFNEYKNYIEVDE